MSVAWRIANGVLLLESTEKATFWMWREAMKKVVADPGYRPGMSVVHDWRHFLSPPPGSELLARVSYMTQIPVVKGTRWAFVVANSASYGMGRMAEILMEPSPVELRVFRDPAEAEEWVREGLRWATESPASGIRAQGRQGAVVPPPFPHRVLVLLLGTESGRPADLYQDLQGRMARAKAKAVGIEVEVVFRSAHGQRGVIRKRLGDASHPLDAVVVEPATVDNMDLILGELHGRTGVVLLNAWDPVAETHRGAWGSAVPFGAISMPHTQFGELQGKQVSAVVGHGASILVVTGPSRSSAAVERLHGLKASARPDIHVFDAPAGQWTETEGARAFRAWYSVFESRRPTIEAIVGQSDDLAVGARQAAVAVPNAAHTRMFAEAKYFGVGAVPGFGKEKVDDGILHASIVAPPNAGKAVDLLHQYWTARRPLPLHSLSEAVSYWPSRAGQH